MNEKESIKQIGAKNINKDNTFTIYRGGIYANFIGNDDITLDGSFDADELEAFAWWIRNKQP